MEWKKIASMEYGKISSILYHALPSGTHAAKKNFRHTEIYTTTENKLSRLRNPLWMKNVVILKYTMVYDYA